MNGAAQGSGTSMGISLLQLGWFRDVVTFQILAVASSEALFFVLFFCLVVSCLFVFLISESWARHIGPFQLQGSHQGALIAQCGVEAAQRR